MGQYLKWNCTASVLLLAAAILLIVIEGPLGGPYLHWLLGGIETKAAENKTVVTDVSLVQP
jgi:hypothetical protein